MQYLRVFPFSFFKQLVLSCCDRLLDFQLCLAVCSINVCISLESLSDTGMTLSMSWHNASGPIRLSGRSRITQSRLSHLMLFFRERKHGGYVCVCVLQISCQKFYISLSARVADVVPQAHLLQRKADSSNSLLSLFFLNMQICCFV